MTEQDAIDLNREREFSKNLCMYYDVIVIGDTVPDGRAIYQDIEKGFCKNVHFILETTNRFDWGIRDHEVCTYVLYYNFNFIPNRFIVNFNFIPKFSKGLL
jgi:hypothetical protein